LINIPLSEAESSKIFIELSKNFKLDDDFDWQLFLEYKSKQSTNENKKNYMNYHIYYHIYQTMKLEYYTEFQIL
jgi:hypothetical protein